ncbi:Peptidyl-prolyl cis-trans isomerase [Aphelenchoides besseyi]|nr:Peptidyl-prolyl cis-trans isomerase [Aphelenchoides besseyi]
MEAVDKIKRGQGSNGEVSNPDRMIKVTVGKNCFRKFAPGHVARIKELVSEGAYDGVVFHRVIEDFMAQTGDVKFGKKGSESFNPARAGMGGSDKPDLKAEFSAIPHVRGTCSMARSQNPNSANSQFFICFTDSPWLNKQYTVWGQVIEGMEAIDKIKRGEPVKDPDSIVSIHQARFCGLRIAYKVFTRSAGNCGAFHIDDKGCQPLSRHPRACPEDLTIPDGYVVRSSGQARG